MEKVGNNVKELRISKGITQMQLAEYTGISRDTIAQYETGRAMPSVAKAFLLASALGADIEDVYSFKQYE